MIEDDIETPENEAGTFLKQIASVNKEYRAIPIVQVNRFLIDHYQKDKKKAVFTRKEREEFISLSKLENVHKLDEEIFKEEIYKYIDKNISCDEIPESITLGYPHELFDFRHFRIVDTPGINAKGGLENQTKEFIHKADAVIYLHKAPPVESKSLANALENELPEKVKEHLILVLTHKSNSTDEKSEELLAETKRYYPEIGADNIFFVDSLTELCLRDLEKKEMHEIQTILSKDEEIMKLTAASFLRANHDKHRFLDLLEEQANFREITKRIERDAQNSASNQMKRFANAIQEEYEVLDNKIRARIEPLRQKNKYPQSFASNIQKQKDEIESLRRDYNEFTFELREEFSPSDMNSRYYKKIDQIVNSFLSEINEKDFDPDEHNEKNVQSYMEKVLYHDFGNEMNDFVDSLKADFQGSIANRNIEVQNDYSITVPMLSLGRIWDTAFSATDSEIGKQLDEVEKSKDWGYYAGNIFFAIPYFLKEGEKKEIRQSRPQRGWEEMQSLIVEQLVTHKTQLQKKIDAMINGVCDEYKSQIDGELLKRKKYIEDIEQEKKTNVELRNELLSLEEEKKTIDTNIQICIRVRGEL